MEAVALSPEVETLLKKAETWHEGNHPSIMSLSAHELLTRLASALRASMAEAKDLRMSFEMASAALRASETAKQQAEQERDKWREIAHAHGEGSHELATKLVEREAEIARLRADVFSEVEAEARRRMAQPIRTPADFYALQGLADWCQQQKGQG
jgi:chromosome segregation ATPase